MKIEDLRWLDAVVRHGSISAAARKEKKPIATIARRIAALEGSLGVPLLIKGRDGVKPTREGTVLLKAFAKTGEAMAGLERAARALKGEASEEPVTLSATEPVIASILAPRLNELFSAHPSIRLHLSSAAAVVNLAAGEAGIAIRFAKPSGDSLLVRRIATLRLGLFASPGYLAGRDPLSIGLRQERLLGYDGRYGPIQEVTWFEEQGLSASMALRSSSTAALLNAAIAGAGIALLPAFMAGGAGLIEVPLARPVPPRPVWLMSQRLTVQRPRVRAVWEWAAMAFQSIR
jgi:DNA-binding transcriptional LysR family regulator